MLRRDLTWVLTRATLLQLEFGCISGIIIVRAAIFDIGFGRQDISSTRGLDAYSTYNSVLAATYDLDDARWDISAMN